MKLLLIFLMISAVCTFLMFAALWSARKFKEKAYEEDYIVVIGAVRSWAPSPQTYKKIIDMITKLSLHGIDDPEKTKKLWEEFRQKYAQYDLGVLIELEKHLK